MVGIEVFASIVCQQKNKPTTFQHSVIKW